MSALDLFDDDEFYGLVSPPASNAQVSLQSPFPSLSSHIESDHSASPFLVPSPPVYSEHFQFSPSFTPSPPASPSSRSCPLHGSVIQPPPNQKPSDFLRFLATQQNLNTLTDRLLIVRAAPLRLGPGSDWTLLKNQLEQLQATQPEDLVLYFRQSAVFSLRLKPEIRQALAFCGCVCIEAVILKRQRAAQSSDVSGSPSIRALGVDRCGAGEGCTNNPCVGGLCGTCSRVRKINNDLDQIRCNFNPFGEDTAYYHPCLHPDELLQPGDIVGVLNGAVTKETDRCDTWSAVPQNPGLIRGAPGPNKVLVAYLGQVDVQVAKVSHFSSSDLKVTQFYVIPSGNNDGKGLLRSREELNCEEKPAIVGDVVGDPWKNEDSGSEYLTVRIKLVLSYQLWLSYYRQLEHRLTLVEQLLTAASSSPVSSQQQPLPLELETSQVVALSEQIEPEITATSLVSSERMSPRPTEPMAPKGLLHNDIQKRIKAPPKISIDTEMIGSPPNERFKASRLRVFDEQGTVVFEWLAVGQDSYTTKREAEHAISRMALQCFRAENYSSEHSPKSLSSSGFSPATALSPQPSITPSRAKLQNEARKKYGETSRIQVHIQASLCGPDQSVIYGASHLTIHNAEGKVVFQCETFVPCQHQKSEDCVNASFEIALEKFLSAHFEEPRSEILPTSGKADLQNEIQRKHKVTAQIEVAFLSSVNPIDSTPLYGASHCRIINPTDNNLLYEFLTPVSCEHSRKKAAENASCHLALQQLTTKNTGNIASSSFSPTCASGSLSLPSVPASTSLQATVPNKTLLGPPLSNPSSKADLQNEIQRKHKVTARIEVAFLSSVNPIDSTLLYGASHCRIINPTDNNLLCEFLTPVPCEHSSKKAAENASCHLALQRLRSC